MTDPLEIVRCPRGRCTEALALVLCELAPSQRGEIASELLKASNTAGFAQEPLFIAVRNGELRAAAWGQRQTGNIAVFWQPQLVPGEPETTAIPLANAVIAALDELNTDLIQALVSAPCPQADKLLRQVGFHHSANLLYLTCEAAQFPVAAPAPCELEFERYAIAQRDRLIRLIERTYEGTLDCTELDGVRNMDDVVAGYQATGEFRLENWMFVRFHDQDVGVLLLADHSGVKHRELVYMGLAPEFRGRGWGRQIARYAQWLARGACIERILVAVDAANEPAVNMYRATGFEIWERRIVYLRFPPLRSA